MVGPTDPVEQLRCAVAGSANWHVEGPGIPAYAGNAAAIAPMAFPTGDHPPAYAGNARTRDVLPRHE